MCGLAERPRTYLPVLADIDIKIDNNESIDITKNLYTQKQVKQIIDYVKQNREIKIVPEIKRFTNN
jgi:N-acetyl-beta-hexosaminidase